MTIRTTNKPSSTTFAEMLAHRDAGGGALELVRVPKATLVDEIAGSAVVSSALQLVRAQIATVVIAQGAGVLGFETKELMDAVAPATLYVQADVTNDGANNGRWYWSGSAWVKLTLSKNKPLWPRHPNIVERTKIFVSVFFGWTGAGVNNYVPEDGAEYFVFDKPATGTAWTLWWNRVSGALTLTTSLTDANQAPGDDNIVVMRDYSGSGAVASPYALITTADMARNRCPWTRRINAVAQRLFGTTAVIATPDSALKTSGVAEVFHDDTGHSPFWAIALPTPTERARRCFFRIATMNSGDVTSYNPSVTFWDEDRNSLGTAGDLTVEENTTDASTTYWSASVAVPAGTAAIQIGMFSAPSTVRLGGLQHSIGDPDDAYWVARDDLGPVLQDEDPAPDPGDIALGGPSIRAALLYPKNLYLRADKKLPLYVENLYRDRSDGRTLVTEFRSLKSHDPFVRYSDHLPIMLDPSLLGATADLYQRHRGLALQHRGFRWHKQVTVRTAPATQTASPRILAFTDSIGYNTLYRLDAILQDMGVTPAWMGTIPANGINSEARGGRTFAKYVGMTDLSAPVPVPAGGEDVYLALSDTGDGETSKVGWIPFLRAATGGDNAAYVNNSLIFDPADFVTRFTGKGLANWGTPDIVIFMMGMNDLWYGADQIANWIARGLAATYNMTRASFPDAHIVYCTNTQPRTVEGDQFWPPRGESGAYSRPDFLLRQLIGLEATYPSDDKLHIVGAWAHHSQEGPWTTLTATQTDTVTGVELLPCDDSVHHPELPAYEYMHPLANCVGYISPLL